MDSACLERGESQPGKLQVLHNEGSGGVFQGHRGSAKESETTGCVQELCRATEDSWESLDESSCKGVGQNSMRCTVKLGLKPRIGRLARTLWSKKQ